MDDIRVLLRLREQSGLSPEQVAAALGISSRTLARWVSGRGEPSPLARREIKRFLDEIRAAGAKHADR